MNAVEIADRLEAVNEHRAAVGREPFTDLSVADLEHHERLIDASAPYGDDPWWAVPNDPDSYCIWCTRPAARCRCDGNGVDHWRKS